MGIAQASHPSNIVCWVHGWELLWQRENGWAMEMVCLMHQHHYPSSNYHSCTSLNTQLQPKRINVQMLHNAWQHCKCLVVPLMKPCMPSCRDVSW
jgi:hypothetical protein